MCSGHVQPASESDPWDLSIFPAKIFGNGAMCVRGEGVQGVFSLFCSGAAQVCHDDRVELKEQLEVEEEDGDRQEEKVEVEREKRVKESAPWMTMQMEV